MREKRICWGCGNFKEGLLDGQACGPCLDFYLPGDLAREKRRQEKEKAIQKKEKS